MESYHPCDSLYKNVKGEEMEDEQIVFLRVSLIKVSLIRLVGF